MQYLAAEPGTLTPDDTHSSGLSIRSHLRQIGRARGEQDLARALRTGAVKMLGAADAKILTRSGERPAWPAARQAPAVVSTLPPALTSHLRRGSSIVCHNGDSELDAVPVDRPWETLALQPCSGSGSDHACLFVFEDHLNADATVRDAMETIALVTGLTLDRIDAHRREHMRVSGMENQIRNVVALVRSVSARSADYASSVDDFMMHFDGRIDALARSQLALARSGGSDIDFEMLLREELLAQGITDSDTIRIAGMPVSVKRREAEVLLLGVHELAVNSVKYGAIFHGTGSIAVRWWTERDDDLSLHLTWQESGLFNLDPAEHSGFGRLILEKAIPYELGGRTTLDFMSTGMRCHLAVPLESSRAAESC